MSSSLKIQREYEIKNNIRKEFKSNQLIADRKQLYNKMLKRFDEINKGQDLAVGHYRYKKNLKPLQNSPAFEQHSLRTVARKRELETIEKDNLILMSQILSPNYTVNRSQLEK